MQKKNLIIIFTRFPEPGRTKTRLIETLGPDGAADLQRQMTEHAIGQVLTLQASQSLLLHISYYGGSEAAMESWLGPHRFHRQPQGDLGTRMRSAFFDAFQDGMNKVIIIGTDCPQISPLILTNAINSLNQADLVLGPAHDGGYYLIGQKRTNPFLFEDIPWGTELVLEKTLEAANQHNLIVTQLESLHDIDRPEDLHHFRYYSGS